MMAEGVRGEDGLFIFPEGLFDANIALFNISFLVFERIDLNIFLNTHIISPCSDVGTASSMNGSPVTETMMARRVTHPIASLHLGRQVISPEPRDRTPIALM